MSSIENLATLTIRGITFKMNFIIVLILLFTVQSCVQKGETNNQPIKKETMNNFWAHHFSMSKDVKYGDDPAQRMDIYLQGSYVGEPNFFKPSSEKFPTLVFFHGGGWVQGDKESRVALLMPYLQKGYNVVNVEYRVGMGTVPNAAEDALTTLKWIAENGSKYTIDTDKIVLTGNSAGGHLALWAGMINSIPASHPSYVGDKLKVRAVVNWFGITDIEKVEKFLGETKPASNYALAWIADPAKVAAVSKKYSPIHLVQKDIVPILTIHGTDDSLVPHSQAIALHDALEEVGAKQELLSMEGGKHMGFSEEQFQQAWGRIFSFLEEQGL